MRVWGGIVPGVNCRRSIGDIGFSYLGLVSNRAVCTGLILPYGGTSVSALKADISNIWYTIIKTETNQGILSDWYLQYIRLSESKVMKTWSFVLDELYGRMTLYLACQASLIWIVKCWCASILCNLLSVIRIKDVAMLHNFKSCPKALPKPWTRSEIHKMEPAFEVGMICHNTIRLDKKCLFAGNMQHLKQPSQSRFM